MQTIRATDPGADQITVLIGDRKVGGVLAIGQSLEDSEGWLLTVIHSPVPGQAPEIRVVTDDKEWSHFPTEKVRVPYVWTSDVVESAGWIYWTGEGWCDEMSRPIYGPRAEVLP